MVVLQDGVSTATEELDEQGLGRLVEGCPLIMVEPVVTPLDESTSTAPQLSLPGPYPMLDLHQAASDATTEGLSVPDVGAASTTYIRGLPPAISPSFLLGLHSVLLSHWR